MGCTPESNIALSRSGSENISAPLFLHWRSVSQNLWLVAFVKAYGRLDHIPSIKRLCNDFLNSQNIGRNIFGSKPELGVKQCSIQEGARSELLRVLVQIAVGWTPFVM